MDAIELLKKDHQEVTRLFQRFSGRKGRRNDTSVVEKICDELDVHARIEEEIFYPAVREASSELARKVDESLQEHARVKEQVRSLREQLRGGAEGDEALEGQMSALEQDVEHHVTEEEGEMFPQVAEEMDERQRTRLGERLKARKGELSGTSRAPRERGERRRASTGRRQRAKTTSARGKTKARRGRTSTRRTSARAAKRTTGRSRQRKRARARRR
jgi:hemerythrin superfamily protein